MSYREIPLAADRLKTVRDAVQTTERLQAILLRFYERMAADLMIGFFFSGKDLPHIAAQQGAFLARALGLAASYSGKAPADAHNALPPILPGHFDRRLRLLEETLQEEGLPEDAIQAWLGFENAFRKSIVTNG